MNAVVFYSATGQSLSVGRYFSEALGYPLIDIHKLDGGNYENLVLVFPVHCQNLPPPVKAFLKTAHIENLTAVATYGKMCPGNVLYEIQKKFRMRIVAGAYVPTKHAYLKDDGEFTEFERLAPLVEKIENPSAVTFPKLFKNPLSDLFPRLRSRLGVKLKKSSACDDCGMCTRTCPLGAVENGVTNGKCIRCLKCVSACPKGALTFTLKRPMRIYLKRQKNNRLIIYI